MEKRFYGKTDGTVAQWLLPEITGFHSLREVFTWASTRAMFRPEIVSALVVQDEFTHDLVIPCSDGSVLVLETT